MPLASDPVDLEAIAARGRATAEETVVLLDMLRATGGRLAAAEDEVARLTTEREMLRGLPYPDSDVRLALVVAEENYTEALARAVNAEDEVAATSESLALLSHRRADLAAELEAALDEGERLIGKANAATARAQHAEARIWAALALLDEERETHEFGGNFSHFCVEAHLVRAALETPTTATE